MTLNALKRSLSLHPSLLASQSDNGNYDLILRALLPKPDVRLVGDLMFGLLPLESKASKHFKLVNHGMQAVPFRVDWEK